MDALVLTIPFSYVAERLGEPTWADVLFGLDEDLIASSAPAEMADRALHAGHVSDPVLELVNGVHPTEAHALVRGLVDGPLGRPATSVEDRWLYLVLAWVYDHRAQLRDTNELLDLVYANFGYPHRVGAMIGWVPAGDDRPPPRTPAEGKAQLMRAWEAFLVEEERVLNVVRMTVDAVRRLAAPADEQEAWVREVGADIDELALELDDTLDAALPYIAAPAADILRRLDAQLDAMSGEEHAELWTFEALADAAEWAEVRRLARDALTALPAAVPPRADAPAAPAHPDVPARPAGRWRRLRDSRRGRR